MPRLPEKYASMIFCEVGAEAPNKSVQDFKAVISEVPTSASGYHMNLQPMLRLVAGGIYQNRERMDAQFDEMKGLINRLEKELEEVRNG